MFNIKIYFTAVILLFGNITHAQELLTIEEAIAQALANNYNIKFEKYNVEVSENSVSRALSGQRPTTELTVSYEWGYADAEISTLGQGEASNPPLNLDGTSNDFLVSNQVNIPIFQGFKGKYTYKQLENNFAMSEIQLDNITEQVIAQTVSAYLQISRMQNQLAIDQSNIALSYDRWQRALTDAEFGVSNTLRGLQAQVDLKTDSATYRTNLLEYENAKRDLNVIIVREADIDYAVQEDILLIENLNYESLLQDLRTNNPQLKLSERGVENAVLQTKISNATKMPTIQGYANMSYFDTQDEASFLQSQTVTGPNVGVQLSFPIFTSGANKIQRQNAQVQLLQQQTSLKHTSLLLERDLQNAFAQYVNNKEQLRIEQSNLPTFEHNFNKVAEDYKLGLVDETDLRTAQLNLSLAKNRINNLKYGVKQSEIILLQLSGRLRQTNN